jgi:TPR repeat protein
MSIKAILAAALFATSANAETIEEAARKCEALMAASPVMEHPEMQEAVKRVDATPVSIFTKIDELAERGYANAQYTMAVMNQSDTCVNRDLKLALRYHTRAAELGMPQSQRTLAENYLLGPHAPEAIRLNIAADPVRAYMWYRLMGDAPAMATLKKKLTALQVAQAEAMAATLAARRQ